MKLSAQNSIAMIIDEQERLMPVIDQKESVIDRTVLLIQGLKELGVPMVVTEQYTKGLGFTVAPVQEALQEAYQPLEKRSFSCMLQDEMRQAVLGSGKKQVIICGAETHICVMQTVRDLLAEGCEVILAVDALGSRREYDKRSGIARMAQEGAIISSVESILFELTETSTSEHFKAISKLVK